MALDYLANQWKIGISVLLLFVGQQAGAAKAGFL